jgi:RimK family alpha-L-glutamate ligase
MRVWILSKTDELNSYSKRRFVEIAEKTGIDIGLVVPEAFDIIVTKDDKRSILYDGEEVELPDCLIPRMGAGTTYFAMAVIRHLEKLGVHVLNTSQSIELAKDKLAAMQILSKNNIPIPKTMLAKFPIDIPHIENEFTYPIILKNVSGSHGKGVFLCENNSQLEDLAELMETSKDPKVNVILQEFVSSSKGKDIRVFIVGGRPIGAMLRKAGEGKFKANFSRGGSVEPFALNPAVEWLAVESANLIGLDIAGVDILFDGDSYKVCEVNSSPGFEGFEQATGLDVPQIIFNYIRVMMEGSQNGHKKNPSIRKKKI